jgi:hypothetical protein
VSLQQFQTHSCNVVTAADTWQHPNLLLNLLPLEDATPRLTGKQLCAPP